MDDIEDLVPRDYTPTEKALIPIITTNDIEVISNFLPGTYSVRDMSTGVVKKFFATSEGRALILAYLDLATHHKFEIVGYEPADEIKDLQYQEKPSK